MPFENHVYKDIGAANRHDCVRLIVLRAALAVFLPWLCGCSAAKEPLKQHWLAMGTFASVTVPAEESENLDRYARIARGSLLELEQLLSVYDPKSEISRINRAAGGPAVPVSAHTMEVLTLAVDYAKKTGGCFDPTIGPLMRLWGFNSPPPPRVPPQADLQSARRLVGYGHIALANETAHLDSPGTELDLGGIAKGYAVDICYRRLKRIKARSALLNLGGNMRCCGTARRLPPGNDADEQPVAFWKVGVRDPFRPDRIVGTIRMPPGAAVATSGDYERFVTIGDEQYAHIMDPRTGYPVKGMAAVTVLSTSALEADVMSTALFVMGIDQSRELLGGLFECQALFIPDRLPLELWITAGFREYFTAAHGLDDAVTEIGTKRESE